MDATTLERLLIDRQLGELSADAGELLDAYLAAHAEHAGVAEAVQRTITLTQRAIGDQHRLMKDEMPPPSARVLRTASRRLVMRRWRRHLATAAVVLLAFFLGGRTVQPPRPADVVLRPVLRAPEQKRDDDGFWSVRRLKERRTRRPTRRSPRLEWMTPLEPPRMGERT